MKAKSFFHTAGLALLLLIVCISLLCIAKIAPTAGKNVDAYASSDVMYSDGSTAHFQDKNFGRLDKHDVAALHLRLPEQPIFNCSVLRFYSFNAVTEVWFGDKLLMSYGADIAAKNMMIGNRYFQIPIPEAAWGSEITITLRATTDHAFSDFTNLMVYPSEYAYRYSLDMDPFDFICAIVLFTLGLFGLLACPLSRIREASLTNAICLALTMLLVSLWLIANEGIYTFFGLDGYFWQPLEYMAGYTIAIPLLLFYRGMADKAKAWHNAFGIAAVAVTVFFVIATFLNFTTILPYDSLMTIGGLLLIASGILMFLYTVQMKTGGSEAQAFMKTGMCLFLPTCIYEVFLRTLFHRLSLTAEHANDPLIAIGAMLFLLCLVCSYIADLYGKQKDLLPAQIKAETLDKMFAAVPAGICQLAPDSHLTVISANDIFYHIMGYRDEELSHDKPKDISLHLLEEEKCFFSEKMNEVLQSTDHMGQFEFSTVNIDDEPITVLVRYFYDKSGSGNVTVNLVDITDRKRMEEELRIREEDYRMAIETSDNYYLNYDIATKTCTHLFDSEELFGVSEKVGNIPESLIELGLCAPESVEDYQNAFRQFASGVPTGRFCLHLRNIKTHVCRWYDGSFRTIFDAYGAPLHAIVAFKDITEQREKEIAYTIHKQQIEAHPEDEITYYELNLTTGMCEYHYGIEARRILENGSPRWDDMVDCAANLFVYQEDRHPLRSFLQCAHLLDLYAHGITEALYEYRGYRSCGDMHWLRASVSIASDSSTHEVKAYCSIEDIEDEKAEKLEHQTEQQRSSYYAEAYDKLSSAVMYGVCKYRADEQLSIVFANDIFYEMHGYSSQEEAVAAGFTSILFATPPFGREQVLAAHREYIEGKANQLFETEYPSVDAHGNRIWILCRGIYSSEENIFNSSVLNITDRRKAEDRLRVSEERYRLALSQSGKVFFFFDVPSRTMRLSDELAQTFGLPNEVDNMPDNFISQGLVEPRSVDAYRHFYERIVAGEASGDTVISCHVRQAPDQVLWYRIAFTSVFDAKGAPQSAIITYEDLQEQRAREIAGAWKQFNLLSLPESKYMIMEYNLTQNQLLSETGGLFAKMPVFVTGFDGINAFVLDHFIYEEDIPAYRQFLDRQRVLALFEAGVTEDSIEYRSLQSGSTPRWTTTSLQMIRDPYSGDVLAQMLVTDTHAEKSGQIEMAQSLEELKKELENSRIKVMINQMQPHFLYNALSAIQTIVKTDPDYAYRLIYDFTVHLRSSIKALSSDAPIPFSEELKNIKAYLNIEQMRFGDNLRVNYEIDCDHFSVIPLSIQPLAENAARHGVYPKGDEGGTVTVRTYETATAYIVEVEDDGAGFDANEVLNRQSDSVGLKSLIFRLKSLMNADVVIMSKVGCGTKVTVTIPKKED